MFKNYPLCNKYRVVNRFISITLLFFYYVSIVNGKPSVTSFELYGYADTKSSFWLYIRYYSFLLDKSVLDSSLVKDGNFFFKGIVDVPTLAFLKPNSSKDIDSNTCILFIEPIQMKIRVTQDPLKIVQSSGSESQLQYESFLAQTNTAYIKYKDFITTYHATKNQRVKDSISNYLEPYYQELKQINLQFFSIHPNSYVTGYLLRFYYGKLPVDSLKMFYDRMGEKLKSSIYGNDLASVIKRRSAVSSGKAGINFSTLDIAGNQIALTDFRGKYVLLDFWASWCGPCRAESPHLKNLYYQYKDKGLEIIGIADDDSKPTAWKNAVQKDGLPWKQVLRGSNKKLTERNLPDSNDISKKYAVGVLPTKILIDRQGSIIGTYVGNDKSLDVKLAEVFK